MTRCHIFHRIQSLRFQGQCSRTTSIHMYSSNYFAIVPFFELISHRIVPAKRKPEINEFYVIRVLVEEEEVLRLKIAMGNL
jgi:hypothetical protein